MQDIHTIGVGGGGRLFGGAERRLRPHHHHLHGGGGGGGGGQTLKCPRCDSVNTKFCYYNNYNLSQPRHFCKSCRRYWTKGGVLRNVPVGGGCRKTKRKSENGKRGGKRENEENSQSSSESSSLTASAAAAAAEIVSDAAPSSRSDTSPSAEQILAPSLPPETLDFSQNPILDTITSFSDPSDTCEIGTFTSMMTSSSNPMMMGFDFSYRLPLHSDGKVVENPTQWTPRQQEESATRMPEELKMGFLDPTAQMDLSGRMDHELFDLTTSVDQSYWSQSQWTDMNDHPLYLP